jgi:preprotein translocase subunit YajC
VKWLAEGKQRKQAEERTRVLEFIHCAELISTTGNALGTVHAAAADGRPVDKAQAAALTNQFNEALTQLNRLRLEIAKDEVVKVENETVALMMALTTAELDKDKAGFAALIKKVGDFKTARSALIDAAKKKYAS